MESKSDSVRSAVCTVHISASEPLARAPLSVRAEVVSDEAPDLRGLALYLEDDEGSVVERLELTEYDGAVNRTAHIEIVAPDAPGSRAWTLVFPEQTKDDVTYAEARTPVALTVVAHPVRANAWSLPVAPVAGEPVTLRVGAKGTGDALAERPFRVVDEGGDVVAAGRFGAQPVAGSSGLYDAEVALPTPSEPGVVRWTLEVPPFDEPLPHAAGRHDFSVRTAEPPACAVTVRAIDVATRAPVPNAEVVLHPYRGTTGADGAVTVPVAVGGYTLFVSGPGYDIFRTTIEVTGDVGIDSELIAVVEPDPGDAYA